MCSEVKGKARVLAATLLALMLVINGMNVVNSYVGRYFMSAIERREMHNFILYAWLYLAVFAGSTTVAVFFRYSEERLALLWRDWLTRRVVGIYISKGLYLKLQDHGPISNPDQRIAEDVRTITATTLSFTLMILNSSLTAIAFAGVLWGISPMLFVASVLYAAFGSLVTVLLGRSLLPLNYTQADFEANFRTELIQVREQAQEILEEKHEDETIAKLNSRVDDVISNQRRIIDVNRSLGFFTTGYNYIIQLLPVVIVAPFFIREGTEFGIIGQSAMAFSTMVGAFSLIVTQFQSISGYAAQVARLNELVEAAEKPREGAN